MPAFLRKAAALCALMAGLGHAAAAQPAYSQLVVFGDSLSDVGNNGRFTAGYLWDEHVSGTLGSVIQASKNGGTDYAISGALITATNGAILSLPAQLHAYLTAHPKADPKALYVIWGGGNDAFSTLGTPANGPAVEAAGIKATLDMVFMLHAAGARNILIGNVPHTDLTPFVQSLGDAAVAQQLALVTAWNEKLGREFGRLGWPGTRLFLFDSAASLQALFTSPTHYNFTNLTTPCGSSCADPDHTLFWDSIHPGATGHAYLASAIGALAIK